MEHLESVRVHRRPALALAGHGARPARPSNGTPRSSRTGPNELIAWRSLDGRRRAQHRARCASRPPRAGAAPRCASSCATTRRAGALGALVAKLFGEEPGQQVDGDLRRFKQVLETGEVVHSDASIHRGMHPAQPRGASARASRRRQAMKANCWMGKKTVQVEDVPDPKILNTRDAIVRITSTAICGSDLHLYNGFIPTMEKGDVLGHEFMGEVVEVGRGVKNLKVGDRVVVPFPIACGACCHVPARAVLAVRELEPERLDGREADGALARGAVRLLAHARRLRRRPGGVRARAVRRRRPAQGARRADRRAGAVPVGHPPDRLHGRGDVQHPAGRRDRGVGLRARSASSRSRAPRCSAPSA